MSNSLAFKEDAGTYRCWVQMKCRCSLKTHRQYIYYGGRGIAVCKRWRKSYAAFLDDMGHRPTGMSIDRINNDGSYSKRNCRWATPAQQARNKHAARIITYKGESLSIHDWSERIDIPFSRLAHRLRIGWSARKILFTPKLTGWKCRL